MKFYITEKRTTKCITNQRIKFKSVGKLRIKVRNNKHIQRFVTQFHIVSTTLCMSEKCIDMLYKNGVVIDKQGRSRPLPRLGRSLCKQSVQEEEENKYSVCSPSFIFCITLYTSEMKLMISGDTTWENKKKTFNYLSSLVMLALELSVPTSLNLKVNLKAKLCCCWAGSKTSSTSSTQASFICPSKLFHYQFTATCTSHHAIPSRKSGLNFSIPHCQRKICEMG